MKTILDAMFNTHNSEIWNAARKVKAIYDRGWKGGQTVFKSLSDCEKHLQEKFGKDTYIDLKDDEIHCAAAGEARTILCGNEKRCAVIML